MVVLNDEINAAREVTKTDALRLQTFQTRGYGILGVVDSDRVAFYRRVERRHTAGSEFDIANVTDLPRVDIVLTYQGAPGDLIRAAVDAGARGIVIATAGAGATSGTQGEGIRYATSKGVAVVSTTRTGSGRIAGGRGLLVPGEDLAPLKARILLMLALTKTSEPAELRRIFSQVLNLQQLPHDSTTASSKTFHHRPQKRHRRNTRMTENVFSPGSRDFGGSKHKQFSVRLCFSVALW